MLTISPYTEPKHDEAFPTISPRSLSQSPSVVGERRLLFRLSVKDSGVGVSKEDQQKLFRPYSQLSAGKLQRGRTAHSKYPFLQLTLQKFLVSGQGTGLGLSIAKHLITMHGGTIGCTSEANVGSEFFFSLPAAVVQAPEATDIPTLDSAIMSLASPRKTFGGDDLTRVKLPSLPSRKEDEPKRELVKRVSTIRKGPHSPYRHQVSFSMSPVLPGTPMDASPVSLLPSESIIAPPQPISDFTIGEPIPVGPLRVLLVEDHPATQKLMLNLLRKMGFEAQALDNGQHAVDELVLKGRSTEFDIILMDNIMPGLCVFILLSCITPPFC